MRSLIRALCFGLGVVFLGGCGKPIPHQLSEEELTEQAIQHVILQDDRARETCLAKLPPDATPAKFAQHVEFYLHEGNQWLSEEDKRERGAYLTNVAGQVAAWEDAMIAAKQLPESFLKGHFMEVVNALLRGDADAGAKILAEPMRGPNDLGSERNPKEDLKNALERARLSRENAMKKIGAK